MLSLKKPLVYYSDINGFLKEYNGAVRKEAIGQVLKNTNLSFLHFWSLYMILAITEEGKILLNDFATVGHSDLFHPKNIFHYISGPVNNILKGFKDYEKNT